MFGKIVDAALPIAFCVFMLCAFFGLELAKPAALATFGLVVVQGFRGKIRLNPDGLGEGAGYGHDSGGHINCDGGH